MDLLFDPSSPKAFARAVAPWLAVVLLAIGVGSIAFDQLVLRPEIARLSTDGRAAVGRVGASSVLHPSAGSRGTVANRSLVAVEDPELGIQLVSVYGRLPVGTTVPVLCLTSARRCLAAAEVKERLNLWPLTPLTLSGSVELLLAALLAVASRRQRALRRRAIQLASIGLLLTLPGIARAEGPEFKPGEDALREQYRQTAAAFEAKRYEDAVRLGAQIVDAHRKHEAAVYAENIVLGSLLALRRGHEIVARMDDIERRSVSCFDPGAKYYNLKSDAYELIAREAEGTGQFWECGRFLLAAADTAPDNPRHTDRLFDAAICFHKAHGIGQALRARLVIVRDHPKTRWLRNTLYLIAENYRELARYTKAAEYYEDFAGLYPRDDRAAPALMLAAQLRLHLIPDPLESN